MTTEKTDMKGWVAASDEPDRNLAEATLSVFECILRNVAHNEVYPDKPCGGPDYAERRDLALAEVREQGGAALERTWAESVAALLELTLGPIWGTSNPSVYRRIVTQLEKRRAELGLEDAPMPDTEGGVVQSLVAFREKLRQEHPLSSLGPDDPVN